MNLNPCLKAPKLIDTFSEMSMIWMTLNSAIAQGLRRMELLKRKMDDQQSKLWRFVTQSSL